MSAPSMWSAAWFLAVLSTYGETTVALLDRLDPRTHLAERRVFGSRRIALATTSCSVSTPERRHSQNRPHTPPTPVALATPDRPGAPMTEGNPTNRMSDGYAHQPAADDRNVRFRAASYQPERDAEADGMRRIADQLTPSQRMQLGYHDSAKTAAEILQTREDSTR